MLFIIMNRLSLFLPFLLLAACDEPTPTTPAEVTAQIRAFAAEQCGEGEDGMGFEPGYLEVIDLSKDKQPDYLVNYAAIRCGGEVSKLCSERGCRREVWVSDGRGDYKLAFDRTARGFALELDDTPPTVAATLSGDICRRSAGVKPQDANPVCQKLFVFDPIQLHFVEAEAARQPKGAASSPTPHSPVNGAPDET